MSENNGSPLDIRVIPLSKIFRPPEYQRLFRQKRADGIAADFKPEECALLAVTDRGDDTFAITEGQHRLDALRQKGYTEWPCLVMSPRSLASEAQYFVDVNVNRTALAGADRWRARRVAQDPNVIAIEEIVASVGLTADQEKRANWRNIRATNALERIYISMGPKHLLDVLRIAGSAWPEDSETFKGPVLLGLASFLFYYADDSNLHRSELVTKFSAIPVRRLLQRAAEIGGGVNESGGTDQKSNAFSWAPGMVRALVMAYNYKRQNQKYMLEDPTLRGWRSLYTRAMATKKAAAAAQA